MAAVIQYDEKDVPQFQKEMCPKCVKKGECITEGKDNHWFLTCPHYHRWKLGYSSFVFDYCEWEREHPEEVAKIVERNKESAKRLREERKKAKEKQSD